MMTPSDAARALKALLLPNYRYVETSEFRGWLDRAFVIEPVWNSVLLGGFPSGADYSPVRGVIIALFESGAMRWRVWMNQQVTFEEARERLNGGSLPRHRELDPSSLGFCEFLYIAMANN